MATTKKTTATKKATTGVTKVICSNCGAEIVIPNNEIQGVVGTVIGKDSGLGTIVLPTTCSSKMTPSAAMVQLQALADANPAMKGMVDAIVGQIGESYIDVKDIVRRWIPSQCLRMLNSTWGFHKSLVKKGYDYSWDVLVAEMNKQAKLYKDKDMSEFRDRNRWYNKAVAEDMAEHYISTLKKDIQEMDTRKHKNREYVRITCWLNSGKGVHLDEMYKIFDPLNNKSIAISEASTPRELAMAVEVFYKLLKKIKNWRPEEQSPSFMNAYKAAGAYYTMKDLIMFEGCKLKVNKLGNTDAPRLCWNDKMKFASKQVSLELLEGKAEEIVHDCVRDSGYMMLGLLKAFLEYNGFNYQETKQAWAEQSEKRKAAHRLAKTRRARK